MGDEQTTQRPTDQEIKDKQQAELQAEAEEHQRRTAPSTDRD